MVIDLRKWKGRTLRALFTEGPIRILASYPHFFCCFQEALAVYMKSIYKSEGSHVQIIATNSPCFRQGNNRLIRPLLYCPL